ncbi:MAG: sulfatase [Limisphaerales bacterium]
MNPTEQLGKCAAAAVVVLLSLAAATRGATVPPPNMLVILVDDMRWDDPGCAGHPFSKTPNMDRIAREGARFLNAFAVTPLCSPSRATLLTGLYPHTHGITDNTERSVRSHHLPTFPQSLQRAGYETAFLGKWHMGNDDSPRAGFDHWVCLKGQGSTFDPELNVNGSSRKEAGYVTDVLHRHAMDFLRRPRTKPFLLYFAHKAVHPETVQRADGSLSDPNAANFIPTERHRHLYAGEKIPRRPNALVAPQGKPALQRPIAGLPPLSPATGSTDESILGRLRMLAAVDESLGEMLRWLEKSGRLDRTLIVVTSDHGYFYGEHGLSVERRLAYEEGIRIPLLMRLPGVINPGSEPAGIALTLDLAPTLLELGHAASPAGLQGRSLVPVFKGAAAAWRGDFLIEYFTDTVFPRIHKMGYQAVRSERWKLIHYTELPGMDELYDLEADPYELKNRAADPQARDELGRMKSALTRLVKETAGTTTTSNLP